MGNLFRAMTSWATALDRRFGRFTATLKPQSESRKIDLYGYHHPNYFAILVPKICLISKIWKRS